MPYDDIPLDADELFMSNPAGNFGDDDFTADTEDPYDFFRPDYDQAGDY